MTKRPKNSSTRALILGWILVPLVLAMSAGFSFTSLILLSQVSDDVEKQLFQEEEELQVLAERAINPNTGENYTSAEELLSLYVRRTVPDEFETVFVIVDGKVKERSSGGSVARLDRDENFLREVFELSEPRLSSFDSQYGKVRYIAVPVAGVKDSGVMVSAIFLDQREAQVRTALLQLALFLTLAFLGAGLIGWLVAGRILKPIRDLRDTTLRIGEGNLQERLDVENPNSELGSIAQEFNKMLDRIRKAFDSQRRFVDDAGHELRTPLTIVSGHLDLVKGDSADSNASLAIVRDEVSRMSRIVQDLQTLTKANEPRFVQLEMVDVSETIDEVFVKATGLADRNWLVSEVSKELAKLDRQRITQAMLQLVDNALKHTQESDSVEIGARLAGQNIEFFVADSGPGIPKNKRDEVTKRFVRGEWTGQDVEGSGLGLAIVDAVARAHFGSVEIRDSHLGGAEVLMVIPRLQGS